MKARLFLLFLSLAALVQAQTVLLLRSSVKVSGAEVLLQDLISDPALLPEEWAERRVFSSPPVGEVNSYALTTIAHALHNYYDMQRVVLRGEPIITVQRKDRRLTGNELEDPIAKYLAGHSPWKGQDLLVDVVQIPQNTRIPEGETTFSVTEVDEKTARGYSLAYVQIRVDDVSICEVPIGIEIQSLTDVWVVRNPLRPGHTLTSEDLRLEKRVVDATSGYVPGSEKMFGYEVSRGLSAGSMLLHSAVRKPVCVRRGDWVAINAYGGNMQITLRAKALANGRLGDRILCVNEQSQRQVLVEMVGSGQGVLVRI